jgi:hypothetical protein
MLLSSREANNVGGESYFVYDDVENFFFCPYCRNIPPNLRSIGSTYTSPPQMQHVRAHYSVCTGLQNSMHPSCFEQKPTASPTNYPTGSHTKCDYKSSTCVKRSQEAALFTNQAENLRFLSPESLMSKHGSPPNKNELATFWASQNVRHSQLATSNATPLDGQQDSGPFSLIRKENESYQRDTWSLDTPLDNPRELSPGSLLSDDGSYQTVEKQCDASLVPPIKKNLYNNNGKQSCKAQSVVTPVYNQRDFSPVSRMIENAYNTTRTKTPKKTWTMLVNPKLSQSESVDNILHLGTASCLVGSFVRSTIPVRNGINEEGGQFSDAEEGNLPLNTTGTEASILKISTSDDFPSLTHQKSHKAQSYVKPVDNQGDFSLEEQSSVTSVNNLCDFSPVHGKQSKKVHLSVSHNINGKRSRSKAQSYVMPVDNQRDFSLEEQSSVTPVDNQCDFSPVSPMNENIYNDYGKQSKKAHSSVSHNNNGKQSRGKAQPLVMPVDNQRGVSLVSPTTQNESHNNDQRSHNARSSVTPVENQFDLSTVSPLTESLSHNNTKHSLKKLSSARSIDKKRDLLPLAVVTENGSPQNFDTETVFYTVKLPKTYEGFMLKLGETCDKSTEFMGFCCHRNGDKTYAERQKLIRNKGDILVAVNGHDVSGKSKREIEDIINCAEVSVTLSLIDVFVKGTQSEDTAGKLGECEVSN